MGYYREHGNMIVTCILVAVTIVTVLKAIGIIDTEPYGHISFVLLSALVTAAALIAADD